MKTLGMVSKLNVNRRRDFEKLIRLNASRLRLSNIHVCLKWRRLMETEPLKILLIGSDERSASSLAGLLRGDGTTCEPLVAPNVNAGLARLSQNVFDVVLLELPDGDKDGLAQVTLLAVQAP